MPWRETARDDYRWESGRYASDMTDREGALIEPFLPPARRHGRPRTTDLREVVNAVPYIATSGCQWRMPPRAFPPVSTVRRYFHDWRDSGLWQTIHFHLALQARELEGREARPTAGVPPLSRLRRRIDSQSVKTTESGGISGFDAGKRVKGRKRHIPAPEARERGLSIPSACCLVWSSTAPISRIETGRRRCPSPSARGD